MDARALLRQGDALLRDSDPIGAIDNYRRAARWYAQEGFGLKSLAVWKQVREVVRAHAPAERTVDAEARAALVSLYRSLGLEADALAVESENERTSRLH